MHDDEKFIKNMFKLSLGAVIGFYAFVAVILGGLIYFAIWTLKHFGAF